MKITVVKPAPEHHRRGERRIRGASLSVAALARRLEDLAGDSERAWQAITEAAAGVLELERASLWIADGDGNRLRCVDLFESPAEGHSSGAEILSRDHPTFFRALRDDTVIKASAARTDSRTRELAAGYLIPAGVVSLLAVPVEARGKFAGALLCEHTAALRRWTTEEENFAISAASLASMAMGRQSPPEAPRPEVDDRFRDLVENSADYIFTHDLDGRILSANRAFLKFLGASEEGEILGRPLSSILTPEGGSILPGYLKTLAREGAGRGFMRVRDAFGEERLIEYNNTLRSIDGEPPVVRAAARDVTDYRELETALAERAAFERLITTVSTEFITLSYKEIDAAIGKTLQTLAEFVRADASFVLMFSEDRERADFTHEWRRQGSGAASRQRSSLRTARYPWAMEKIKWFENIRIVRSADLPEEAAAERELLQQRGYESVLAAPIILSGALIGILGVAGRGEKEWTAEGVSLLKIVGEILASAMERKRVEEALRASEERYRLLFERNLAGVYRSTVDGRILDCNDACARIFGFASREELLAYGALEIYFNLTERESLLGRLREDRTLTNFEVCLRRRDGTPVWVLENVSLLPGENGEESCLEGTLIDISDRKHAEAQIAHQASHDALTSLPNRMLMNDRLARGLAQAQRSRLRPAIIFLDLDHFKTINDTLGHAVGDELLKAVAARLSECVREDDTVSRVGGDEFVILLHDVSKPEDAAKVAQKILETLSTPFLIEEHTLYITTSIGVSLYPTDGDDAATMLKNADSAMYRAKDLGRNNYQLCDPKLRTRALARLSLEKGLQRAIERNEFIVFYQPQVSLKSGQIVGLEALVRWRDPERGLISPVDFIPIAEENRLIVPIGEWVLKTALRQGCEWHEAGYPNLRIGVNISARQFEQANLPRNIEHAIRRAGIAPEKVELEITESVAMQDVDRTVGMFAELKEIGVQISIDDFGTGQSSLSYLKRYPINSIKIDQSFVRDVAISPADAAIVKAVIEIAHGLRLRVVAEGVDSEDQRRLLREWRCDEMQGYYFGRPVPAATFRDVLETGVHR